MSNTKTVMGQASNQYVAPTDITDVFSTYLYEGNGSTQTITNGIDLDGEGGLVWVKNRNNYSFAHQLYDTERGAGLLLSSNNTEAQAAPGGDPSTGVSFTSSGFSVGSSGGCNIADTNFASWTFRKAPKFFDVVTYTGDGVAGRTVSHNLGSVPACIMVKRLNAAASWRVYHRGNTASPETQRLILNDPDATARDFTWNDTAPTDAVFTLGSGPSENNNGDTYVAYLFAHNDGDGGFGPDADQDIIKCGSYTGNGSTDGPEIDLGFEPQWVMIKGANVGTSWYMYDTMRGIVSNGNDPRLQANQADAEYTLQNAIALQPNGFKLEDADGNWNGSGNEYIYIAIRRGPLAPPESATEVFDVTHRGTTEATNNNVNFYAGFPIDVAWQTDNKTSAFGLYFTTRLTGGNTYLYPYSTAVESGVQANDDMQNNWGKNTGTNTENTNAISWMWKRAPNFFDVVAYTGDGTAGRTVNHNLGVVPEMMILKRRTGGDGEWPVYHKDLPPASPVNVLFLNDVLTPAQYGGFSGVPTSTDFSVTLTDLGNLSGSTYIAYLFASLDGVSKVGSYTGNGSSQTIDCGFTSGARFILIKRTDSTGDWYIWDTERGIVAGNDPHLSLNTTAAEVTSDDSIDPDNSGFIVNQVSATNINVSSASYIFYAIA